MDMMDSSRAGGRRLLAAWYHVPRRAEKGGVCKSSSASYAGHTPAQLGGGARLGRSTLTQAVGKRLSGPTK
jgi:hypothetical protein